MSLFSFLKKPAHLRLGVKGEWAACRYLKKQGYTVLERNYRSGKHEIDIILRAPDKRTVVFAEVKTRTNTEHLLPREAVGAGKQRYLVTAAQWYLKQAKISGVPVRFDVVEVYAEEDFRVVHIENAFSQKKF